MALGISLAAPRFHSAIKAWKFRSSVQEFSGFLRYTRNQALFTGKPIQAILKDKIYFWEEDKPMGKFPEYTTITLKPSPTEGDEYFISFYPDGSSSGGSLAFALEEKKSYYEVTVHPFTGRVQVAP